MSHSILRSLIAAGLAAAALLGLDPAAGAATRPPKLDYTMTTLPTGMQVVFL